MVFYNPRKNKLFVREISAKRAKKQYGWVYIGGFYADPPLHFNCRCFLVPLIGKKII